MENNFSQLVIPRININSSESIEEARLLVKKFGFDSFILFATEKIKFGEDSKFRLDNLNMVRDMLNLESKEEILFFIDAENGFGRRCSEGKEFDISDIESLDDKDKREIFDAINLELYKNKISFNLAPVLDIKKEDSDVLKGRAFSGNPMVVSSIGKTFLDSTDKNNIIGCLKHFPGHGVISGDTHKELIRSDISEIDLEATHLKPFIELIKNADLVMINHINYTHYDRDLIPASMSYEIMTNILINQLGFSGVIISDSIRMEAITSNFNESKMIEAFVLNGGDLILDPLNPIKCLSELKEIYLRSPISIDRKINKVLGLKDKARRLILK
ncbi:hypothetical protein CL651_002115 [bacterium]|nr:hypothetical protein [bacterium]